MITKTPFTKRKNYENKLFILSHPQSRDKSFFLVVRFRKSHLGTNQELKRIYIFFQQLHENQKLIYSREVAQY